ncbi:MAG: element excision factor XisH family protein [Cyanobacteria bacterium P01_E01_bin.42]
MRCDRASRSIACILKCYERIKRSLAAQKAEETIAVEIKGFTSHSAIADLEQALGQ